MTKPDHQWVYTFGDGKAEGEAGMKNLLGGKGANLAEMSNLGLPVPPGFTITTEVCTYYYDHGQTYPAALAAQVDAALATVGKLTGRVFGDAANSGKLPLPADGPFSSTVQPNGTVTVQAVMENGVRQAVHFQFPK